MVASVEKISVADLDVNIRKEIANIVDIDIVMQVGRVRPHGDELVSAIQEYAMKDVVEAVKNYYSFLGDVDVDISAEEVRDICV
jgi:hypothetical protein